MGMIVNCLTVVINSYFRGVKIHPILITYSLINNRNIPKVISIGVFLTLRLVKLATSVILEVITSIVP